MQLRDIAIGSLAFLSSVFVAAGCQSAATFRPAAAPEAAGTPVKEAPPTGIGVTTHESVDALHVAVFWEAKGRSAAVKLGTRLVKSDEELERLIADAQTDFMAAKLPEPTVAIDAASDVPWGELVRVISICQRAGATRVELLVPTPN